LNILELKEATQAHVVYRYRPEGNGEYGEIRMNISDMNSVVVSRSSEDYLGHYAFKAVKAVEECVKERSFPLEFTQAWY